MDSLLPVAQAPILRMSGGGMSGGSMETLLPAAPPVHIAGMHGGASLLPVAPSVPIAGMHGGADLYSIPYGAIHNTSVRSDHVASFGIVNTFSRNEAALPTNPPCAPITDTPAPLCDILYPFVDRRVQALLKRVRFPSGDADIDMGCGRIVRKGKELTISFHEKAITLLSCDLTGTFAKFHTGMPRHIPLSVEQSSHDKGLLSWMLGSPVTDTGVFDLITFMDQKKSPVLPLQGFRQFLSYHKENVGDMDVLRYAMELYGYRTGAVANTKDLYGLILSPTIAVRRVNDTFSIYENGAVKQGAWDPTWSTRVGGFAVFEPTEAPVLPSSPALATSPASGASSSAIAPLSAPITSSDAAQVGFIGQKIETRVTVPDTQTIGSASYDLRGVIHHSGGVDAGHYVYYYRNPPDNKDNNWVSFSDSDVKKDLDRPDQIHTGYVYLFERQGSPHGPLKGIENETASSCWMNAALQMFYHITEYRNYVEGFKSENYHLPEDINTLTLALQRIFNDYSKNEPASITCKNEYATLFKAAFGDKPMNTHQDTMEFITKVLLRIIDPFNDKGEKFNDAQSTDLYDRFMIRDVSTLECPGVAQATSTTNYPMLTVSLDVPQSPTSLEMLLQDYSRSIATESEMTVADVRCVPTKKMSIATPDNNQYIIVQLKRFKKM